MHFEHFYFSAIRTLGNGESLKFGEEWCVNEENKSISSPCLYNIFSAFSEIESLFTEKYNSAKPTTWLWGKIHKNNYPHVAFAKIRGLSSLFNR